MIAPFADICYFADYRWWEWHTNGIAKRFPAFGLKLSAADVAQRFKEFAGLKVSIESMPNPDPNVLVLHDANNQGTDGLSEQPNAIKTGSNSGYQVINIVALANAARGLLLGYDMSYRNGMSHSHDGHSIKIPESMYRLYAAKFKTTLSVLNKRGVRIINCTPGSSITCYPRDDIERLLPDTSRAVV